MENSLATAITPISDNPVAQQERTPEPSISYRLTPLVNKVMSDFEKAFTARHPIEDRMIEAIYAMENSYTEKKLMQIRSDSGGSEVFVPLTNIKVRAGKAWLTDIYANDEDIFTLEPTPLPDLPDEVEQKLQAKLAEMASSVLSLGGMLDPDAVDEYKQRLKEEYLKEIEDRARRLAEVEQKRIYDQFVQGGFYEAFNKILYDVVLFPIAIMKGPVFRKERLFVSSNKDVVETVIPSYNRVNPLDIYPSPIATDIDSDYIIEILHLTPSDLYNLIGVEGFNAEAIREVLGSYQGGYLSIPSTLNTLTVRNRLEGKNYLWGDLIDVIEYWGSVKGELLLNEGINIENLDPIAYYNICVWIANNKVIKAMLNPDPLGKKPYSKTSFIEVPDSFWGLSVADVLKPIQDAVNALARASINNAVMSSGPIIERNIDRINATTQKQIYPFMIIDAHESAMNSAPAVRVYNVTPTAQQTLLIMQLFQKMADEYSGIPSYAHGDVTVGGSGRTASGLSMLQANASRGIKDVVANIDRNIIEPVVKRQYYFNISYLVDYPSDVPDLQISAKGIASLYEKQAQATRMLEFLQITSNPVDTQLIGAEGRKYMLETIAKNVGIDADKVFANNPELQQMMQAINNQNQTPAPSEPPANPVNPMAQELGQGVNQFIKENR